MGSAQTCIDCSLLIVTLTSCSCLVFKMSEYCEKCWRRSQMTQNLKIFKHCQIDLLQEISYDSYVSLRTTGHNRHYISTKDKIP